MINISSVFCPFSLFKFIYFLKMIELISSKLDNIIKIGTDNFQFVRFSLTPKGDMIVDSSAYPKYDTDYNNLNEYQKKVFFGLTRNGRFYFKDKNSKEIPFYSLTSTLDQPNSYPESCFIQLSTDDDNNGKQYLFNIGNNKAEISDFEKGEVSSTFSVSYFIKTKNSLVSTLFKSSYIFNILFKNFIICK